MASEYKGSARFKAGQSIVWPNGTVGKIVAIDDSDDTLCDECGGWADAWECEPAQQVPA